jgi:putative ABC transport system permease protein
VNRIVAAPEIARTAAGEPIVSSEPVVIVDVPLKSSGTDANVALRGVSLLNGELRPSFRIVAGRSFRPGVHELVVGQGAQAQFRGLDIGSEIDLRNTRWRVVGIFSSDGDVHESEMVADATTVLSAYRRTAVQSLTVQLTSAGAFDRFRSSLTTDRSLSVDVQRERDYFTGQSGNAVTIIRVLAFAVGGIMALGAFFAALNTMYTVVAARAVEVATLRAIGFRGGAVLMSVLFEAMILALIGAALGTLVAWAVFQGNDVSALNPGSFTQLVFHLSITPLIVAQGVVLALAIGLIGGLLPALRAARSPIVAGLRTVV